MKLLLLKMAQLIIHLRLSKKFSSVKAVHLNKPGFLAAVKKGFYLAKGSVVVHIDVDLSTDMSHFKELLKYSKEYDVVTGSRYLEKSLAKSFQLFSHKWSS